MTTGKLSLSSFDNRLMDGLVFCKRLYDWFDQIQKEPNGKSRLRLRQASEKKLEEELFPIARYIQARYGAGRRLRVRWVNGNQQYDAVLLSAGSVVDNTNIPRRQHIEVTTAVHEKEHLSRKLLDTTGASFGPKKISVEPKTKYIVSHPYAWTNREAEEDLTARILERIRSKNLIEYPSQTVLIIVCFLDRHFLADEWNRSIEGARLAQGAHRFYEIFVVDSAFYHSATIWNVPPH